MLRLLQLVPNIVVVVEVCVVIAVVLALLEHVVGKGAKTVEEVLVAAQREIVVRVFSEGRQFLLQG